MKYRIILLMIMLSSVSVSKAQPVVGKNFSSCVPIDSVLIKTHALWTKSSGCPFASYGKGYQGFFPYITGVELMVKVTHIYGDSVIKDQFNNYVNSGNTLALPNSGGTYGYQFFFPDSTYTLDLTMELIARGTPQIAGETYPCKFGMIATLDACNPYSVYFRDSTCTVQNNLANFIQGADTVYIGDTAAFSSVNTTATSWAWSFGDGDSSLLPSPVHIYDTTGTFKVILIASNNNCSDTSFKYITVIAPIDSCAVFGPDASFIQSADTVYTGDTVTFSNVSANTTSWSWSFGDGDSSYIQAPWHVYDSTGTFKVILIASNNNCSDTSFKYITVIARIDSCAVYGPDASFMQSADTTDKGTAVDFTNMDSSITSFLWSFGDGNTSPLPSPSHSYDSAGTFTVTLIAANNYCSDTAYRSITVKPDTNIAALGLFPGRSIKIHPNPAAGIIYIAGLKEKTLFILYNVLGEQVKYEEINTAKESINFSDLQSGVYFYQLIQKNKLEKQGKLSIMK